MKSLKTEGKESKAVIDAKLILNKELMVEPINDIKFSKVLETHVVL